MLFAIIVELWANFLFKIWKGCLDLLRPFPILFQFEVKAVKKPLYFIYYHFTLFRLKGLVKRWSAVFFSSSGCQNLSCSSFDRDEHSLKKTSSLFPFCKP